MRGRASIWGIDGLSEHWSNDNDQALEHVGLLEEIPNDSVCEWAVALITGQGPSGTCFFEITYIPAQLTGSFTLGGLLDKPCSQVSRLVPPQYVPLLVSHTGFSIPTARLVGTRILRLSFASYFRTVRVVTVHALLRPEKWRNVSFVPQTFRSHLQCGVCRLRAVYIEVVLLPQTISIGRGW